MRANPNYTYRVDEQSFLRYWSGTSLMPALMIWGMRHGTFADDGHPMPVNEIAEQTGYTRQQVYDMLRVADSLIVRAETENEVPDIPR